MHNGGIPLRAALIPATISTFCFEFERFTPDVFWRDPLGDVLIMQDETTARMEA